MSGFKVFARNLADMLSLQRLRGEGAVESGPGQLNAVRDSKRVAAVVNSGQFSNTFERFPDQARVPVRQAQVTVRRPFQAQFSEVPAQVLASDGFDAPRRRPVDLSGGLKNPTTLASNAPDLSGASKPRGKGFEASLDDLGQLVG